MVIKIPRGIPRTDAERRVRHKQLYGNEELPQRGYRSRNFQEDNLVNYLLAGSLLTLGVLGSLVFFSKK